MYPFKIAICTFFITGLCLFFYADKGIAQIGIGAGLDIRSEEPSDGYGLRLEYRLLTLPPVADLKFRAHGSYFSQTKQRNYTVNGLTTSVLEEQRAFDVGAALLAKIRLGPVNPYTGIGLGIDSSEFESGRSPSQPDRLKGINEENFFWNLFFGGELSVIPYVKPFFEYRFVQLINPENIDFKDSERFSLGIIFRF